MDDNSNFLNSYKKKYAEEKIVQPEGAPSTEGGSAPLRYEEKSSFVKPQNTGTGAPPPEKKKSKITIPIIIAAVVVVGIVIGLLVTLTSGIEVIDFTNWTVNDVQLWAKDRSVKLQVEEKYNDQIETGKVISQSAPKGTKVNKDDFIKLDVSLGHDLTVSLPLPDLMSMTNDEVEAWAAKNYMTKVRITTEYSDKVPSGKVISYQINDNTVVDQVTRNTPIYVVVSKGSESAATIQVTVPNFKEKSLAESYTFASENGIVLKINEQFDDYAPKGSIMSQSVKADEKIKKGDEVTLTVSKGKMITIPSFSGYTKEKATAVATQLGIPVTIVEKYSSKSTGSFISQSIASGTVYDSGDILELDFSLGNKIVVASFIGQMRDAMESWAKDLNDHGASITLKATYSQSNAAKGTIVSQDVANTVIGIKTTINITVSSGKVIYMPDFVAAEGSGYDAAITREKALAMCDELKIVPVFVAESAANRLPGEVWYQSVAAGTEVTEQTTITLKFNPDNVQVIVPNFVGMTKADILAGSYLKQLDIRFVDAPAHVDPYTNQVCEQSLRANTKAAAGSVITLTISPAP